jgi:cytochrome c553
MLACFQAAGIARADEKPAVKVPSELKDGRLLFENVCAACHGTDGAGKKELKSPAIAGLPEWYASHQLENFRSGIRGRDEKHAQAYWMAAIARSLSVEQSTAVVKHTASLKPPTIPPPPADAKLTLGRELFQERCMECHRYNASGEIAFRSPPLTGQQGWYLTEQLQQFKNGHRGTDPQDVNGAKMVLSSSFIEDEVMLSSLVDYILSLNPAPEAADFGTPSPVKVSSTP